MEFFQDYGWGRKAIYFFLIFWLVFPIHMDAECPEYERYVNEIICAFAKQMKEEFDLYCYGDSGTMPYEVEQVGLRFKAYGRATIEEARILNVLITEKFAQAINAKEEIRPFLKEYPFPSGRVTISVSFNSLLDNPYADGNVSYVRHISVLSSSPYKNYLCYDAENAFTGKSYLLLREPYEEAEKIVRATGLKDPPPHKSTDLEIAIDEVFEAFVEKMQRERGCKLWGIGGKMPNRLEEIDAKFTIFHPTDLKGARELIVFATESLLSIINTNEKLRPYLKEHPFASDHVNMLLNFRDENYLTYSDGTLKSVSLENNGLTYTQEPLYKDGDSLEELFKPAFVVAEEYYLDALNLVERDSKPALENKSKWIISLFAKTLLSLAKYFW